MKKNHSGRSGAQQFGKICGNVEEDVLSIDLGRQCGVETRTAEDEKLELPRILA